MKLTRNVLTEKKQDSIRLKVLEILNKRFEAGTVIEGHIGYTIVDSTIEEKPNGDFRVRATTSNNMILFQEIDGSDTGIEYFLLQNYTQLK